MDNTHLIFKVLSGEGSSLEEKELAEWRAHTKENEREYEWIKLLWEGSKSRKEHSRDDPFYDGFRKIKARINLKVRQRRYLYISSFLVAMTALFFVFHYLISIPGHILHPSNILTFNQETVSEVVSVLENEFDVTITVADATKNCRFTGSFIQNSPSETIRVISESMNLRYIQINDESFRLEGTGCKE